MDKRTKGAFFCIAAILFLFLLPCGVANVKATDTAVTRALSTTYPIQGSTVDVSLNIKDIQIGGIVETIPDGFSFVSTTHPANQTYVSGQKVVFAVVNETTIKYAVRAPSEAEKGIGTRTFSGMWYDALNEAEGDIGSDIIAVRIKSSLATPPPTPTPTATPTPSIPGFEAIFTLAGLLAVAYPLLFMKKGKGERGDRR